MGSRAQASLSIHTTAKGNVLATGDGITLYVYKPDTPGAPPTTACTGTCLTEWPPYYANPPTAPATLSAADFSSFDRGMGKMQSTYKGWPLYTYNDDKKPGDIFGDGEKMVWYAVKVPFTPPK